MSDLKRLLLSIYRHPVKNISIFILLMVLSVFLCSSLTISKACIGAENNFYKEMGNEIEISFDGYSEDREAKQAMIIEDMKYYLNDSHYLQSLNLINALYDRSNETLYFNGQCSSDLLLWGISDPPSSNYNILNGRDFSAEELNEGAMVCLVNSNYTYAYDKKIEPGDIINSGGYDLEVIGIFEVTGNGSAYERREDKVIVPYEMLKDDKEAFLVSIKAKIADVKYNDYIAGQIRNMKGIDKIAQVSTSKDTFTSISRPLKMLRGVADLVLKMSFAATLILLIILGFIFIKSRKYEIGVLLAMGETKRKVLKLYLLELLAISTLAFIVGIVISYFVALNYSNASLAEVNSSITDTLAYQIDYDLGYVLLIFIFLETIVLVSSLLPCIAIVRTKPRQLLL